MWVSGTQDGSSILPGDTIIRGLVAQLVERCIRIAEVAGSSPVESTFCIIMKVCAYSSAVERHSYKVDVLGPNPSGRTD